MTDSISSKGIHRLIPLKESPPWSGRLHPYGIAALAGILHQAATAPAISDKAAAAQPGEQIIHWKIPFFFLLYQKRKLVHTLFTHTFDLRHISAFHGC